MNIQAEIPFNDSSLVVNFSGQPRWEKDTYNNQFGPNPVGKYLTMEGRKIEWESDEYTEEENKAIGDWLFHYDNWSVVENKICKEALDEFNNRF